MKLIFLVLCCILGNIFAIDLPAYFSRCALSDPNLKYCGIAVANSVIPHLVKGDKELGVPVTDPAYVPSLELGGENFKISVTNAYSYDFKKFRLTEAMMDLKKNKASFTAVADIMICFGDYSIINGTLLNRLVSGRGKGTLVLVEPTLRYETDVSFYEKDGEKYAKTNNSTVKLTVNRAYYKFTGLQSSEKGQDLGELIFENWEALYAETKPSLERVFTVLIQSIIVPILEKFPFTALLIQ